MEQKVLGYITVALVCVGVFAWRLYTCHKKRRQICSVTSLDRGTASERALILTLLDFGIPAKSIFHDVYLKQGDNKYTQIDLVVPTKVGILVFEVKDYAGWVYGKGNQTQWTQVLAYGHRKYHFYNPIKQNEHHIWELRKKLGENVPFFSIIVFYGNSKLKDISFVPQGTFVTKWYRVHDILSGILQFNSPAKYKDKQHVMKALEEAVRTGAINGTNAEHIRNIKDMIGKDRVFD